MAVARAFLEDEAELLGIADMSEIQERLVTLEKFDYGVIAHIYYHRVINGLPLNDGNDIRITIDPDFKIWHMSANIRLLKNPPIERLSPPKGANSGN